MYTFYRFLTRISPFLIVPYTFVILIILVYFIYKKWKVFVAIRNVPSTTIFQINLSNVKKNLQITSMVYNFIIFLSASELIENLIWGIANIDIFDFKISSYPVKITKSCTLRDTDLTGLVNSSPRLVHHFMNIGLVMLSLQPTIMCLFIIVLRRVYLNVPYRKWVQGYLVFILTRLIVLVLLTSFIQTWYVSQLLYFPLSCIDVYMYVVSTRKFYLLLKGRRDEAKFHFTKRDYRKKAIIVKRYFYGQIFTGILFALLFLNCTLTFISIPIRIAIFNPCFLNYISIGLIPDFNLSEYFDHIATEFNKSIYITQLINVGVIEVLLFLAYLVLCFIILIKLFVKRYKFKHVNALITKPLMEKYRNDLENHRRTREQRPPFIQDIRSNPLN